MPWAAPLAFPMLVPVFHAPIQAFSLSLAYQLLCRMGTIPGDPRTPLCCLDPPHYTAQRGDKGRGVCRRTTEGKQHTMAAQSRGSLSKSV